MGTSKVSSSQGRIVDGICVESIAVGMKRWKDQAGNFKKQKTRIEKQSEIAKKKSTKQNIFAEIVNRLVDVGGGNMSDLTCSADPSQSQKLFNITMNLDDCEKEINSTCNPESFPKANETFVADCFQIIENFENKAEECFEKSKEATAEDACTCCNAFRRVREDSEV